MTGETPSSVPPATGDVAAWALAWRRDDPALARMIADLDVDEAQAAIASLLVVLDAALRTSAGHEPDQWLRALIRAADATR
ncbi:hypothetical protein F6W70_15435 [Microbacterium maritypicum]|uniref:Uncharacterized protein n=1 Tax=Microbacterium maritypicum TaxID=33918 RepID=A0AAD3ZY85_MICMQ|nr:hypothetical protein [Microbacterium liquefaciens]KAB1883963.1 hypothetical protein F6W70_15435 [Microbacterium liquefaciens]